MGLMSRAKLIFCTIFVLVVLIGLRAWATDWYVRPSGGSYGNEDGTSYTDAWDGFSNIVWGTGGVEAGDTLWLDGSATYTGEYLIITQSGTTNSPIIIDGSYGGGRATIDSPSTNHRAIETRECNYLTIKNIIVDNVDSHGIQIGGTWPAATSNSGNITLYNITVQNSSSSGLKIGSYYDDTTHTLSNILIDSCSFISNDDSGITLFGHAVNSSIKNCIVTNNNQGENYTWGILVTGSTKEIFPGGSNWTQSGVSDEYYYEADREVIDVACSSSSFEWLSEGSGVGSLNSDEFYFDSGTTRAYVHLGGDDPDSYTMVLVYAWAENITVDSCEITGTKDSSGASEGFGAGTETGAKDCTIKNTTSYSNDGGGFISYYSNGTQFYNCLSYKNGTFGFSSNRTEGAKVYNCTSFANNQLGGTSGEYVFGIWGNAEIKNSIANNGYYGIKSTSADTITHTYNCCYGNSDGNWSGLTKDGTEIEQDPLFIDPSGTSNFHLRPTSPCIDAGTPISSVINLTLGNVPLESLRRRS